MKRKQLQKKQFSLLGFVICFFMGHNKVKGVFFDEIGLKYNGKCSRCGALYGHPKFKADGGIVGQVIVDSSLITKFE